MAPKYSRPSGSSQYGAKTTRSPAFHSLSTAARLPPLVGRDDRVRLDDVRRELCERDQGNEDEAPFAQAPPAGRGGRRRKMGSGGSVRGAQGAGL